MSTENEEWAADLKRHLTAARATLAVMLDDDEQHSPIVLNVDRATEVRLFHLLNEMLADGTYDEIESEECILLMGTPGDGFHAIGPFLDSEAAQEHVASGADTDWWIMKLHHPKPDIVPAEPRDAATATGMYDHD